MNLEWVRTRQAQGLHTAQHVFKIPSLGPGLPAMTGGQCRERHGHSRLDTVVFRVGESFMPRNPVLFISNFKDNKENKSFYLGWLQKLQWGKRNHLCFDLNLLPLNYKSWNNNKKILLKLLCSNWLSKTKSQLVSSCHLTMFWCAAKMHLA